MSQTKCLHCNIEFTSYRKCKRKYGDGYKVYLYPKKNIKFCTHDCYHSYSKGKPLTGEQLRIAQEQTKRMIYIRQNNPDIKNRWILKMKSVSAGSKSYNWIKDRSKVINQNGRNGYLDKEWKRGVYKRDNYICRIADDNCSGRIEAHHILPWRDYPELHYKINNGITLCHAHHPRKRAEEKRLEPLFMELVSVSKL